MARCHKPNKREQQPMTRAHIRAANTSPSPLTRTYKPEATSRYPKGFTCQKPSTHFVTTPVIILSHMHQYVRAHTYAHPPVPLSHPVRRTHLNGLSSHPVSASRKHTVVKDLSPPDSCFRSLTHFSEPWAFTCTHACQGQTRRGEHTCMQPAQHYTDYNLPLTTHP